MAVSHVGPDRLEYFPHRLWWFFPGAEEAWREQQ